MNECMFKVYGKEVDDEQKKGAEYATFLKRGH